MFQKKHILALVVVSLSSSAFGWGWKDATSLAIQQNPSLESERNNAAAFELIYQNAKALRYPRVSLIGSMQNYQNQTEQLLYRAYFGPRVQWLLYEGGKVRHGIHRAEAISDQAQAALKLTSVSTNAKLRQAFAQALYAKNYLDLTNRIEKQRKENVKLTEIRYQSGLEYKWVFLSSTAKWKKAQLDVTKAEMSKKTALVDLESILGKLPIQSVEELSEDDFYVMDENYDVDQAMSNLDKNPKLQVQQGIVDQAKYNVDYFKADRYPTFGFQGDFFVASMEQNGLFPFWTTSFGLSIPIFEGNRINRNVSIAKQQLSESNFDYEQTRLNLRSDIQKNYQDYVINKQLVEINKLSAEASEDRAKVVSNQYRSGLSSFLEWERSQDDWVNAEIELLNSIKNYQVSRAKFDEAMGVELQ